MLALREAKTVVSSRGPVFGRLQTSHSNRFIGHCRTAK